MWDYLLHGKSWLKRQSKYILSRTKQWINTTQEKRLKTSGLPPWRNNRKKYRHIYNNTPIVFVKTIETASNIYIDQKIKFIHSID